MQLFNIITITLIIHTLIFIVRGGRTSVLSCGLFAYIGDPQNHTFNWDKFNLLGLDNDERGGDSIGRVVGETVVKFVNNKKAKTTYQDYVINHKNGEPSHMAIGHTRKASVGIVSEANAQPVVLELPDALGRFIMVHNGTLYNHESLADKYGVSKTGKTDSMILAEIIMNNGSDVLKEYEGAAALIYRDDRFPGSLFVFKGESKNYSGVLSEERPLYFYQESENSVYISSRPDGLYFIGGDVDNVYDFDTNVLYEIHEGVIISEVGIDRKNSSQIKKWEPVVATTTNTYKRNAYRGDDYAYSQGEFSYASGWEDFEDNRLDDSQKVPLIYEEPILSYTNSNQIAFARCRYWFWETIGADPAKTPMLAHGPIKLDIYGYKVNNSTLTGKNYFFFYGILMKNKSAYKTVCKLFDKNILFKDTFENLKTMSKFSMYPVCSIGPGTNVQNVTSWSDISNSGLYFSGIISPLWGFHEYTFNRGDLTIRKKLNKKIIANISSLADNEDLEDIEPLVVINKVEVPETKIITLPQSTIAKNNMQSIENLYENAHGISTIKSTVELKSLDEDEDGELLDPIVSKEINDVISTIMMAFDDCKSVLEAIGTDSKQLRNVVENLTKIEDILYNDKALQKKTILIAYDEEF